MKRARVVTILMIDDMAKQNSDNFAIIFINNYVMYTINPKIGIYMGH